eukprot:Plantae.Rhodophyta-Purpureofilum_apyrenoidigerum.ctg10798.p1 GENE.Plantae.Rhodophyta-Purpureofilum_apyrenoidigerum.ctg10798~~Plantae.Rhodophyta-Purpureofilum_apyrenoidigerum.ctg10798.p1  ORF type:complete len:387 (+),score=110.43 Plantae.Rhodophyta-Purpureofilum_apyrenoidigerum.ctg10798:31-1191(+)
MDIDELRDHVRQLAACLEDVKAVPSNAGLFNTVGFDVIVENIVQAAEDVIEQYEEANVLGQEVQKQIELTEDVRRGSVDTRERLTKQVDDLLDRFAVEDDRREGDSSSALLRQLVIRSNTQLNQLQIEVETRKRELKAANDELVRQESEVARLRSQLGKDRKRREEELRHSQKWRKEVGSRLKTTTGQLIELRKERARLVDAFELKAEGKADWQDRGETAQKEIKELRQRAEVAEETVIKLEELRKERTKLAEVLSAEGRQAENAVPFLEKYFKDASFNSRLVRGLQSRLKKTTENVRELESSLKAMSFDNSSLSEEVESLAAEKADLQTKLQKQQRVSNARESILVEGNVLARSMNGAISRWILDERVDLPFVDSCQSARSSSNQ